MPEKYDSSGGWISRSREWTSAKLSILKAIGPLVLSQCEGTSRRWAEHQMRLSEVRIDEHREIAKIDVQKDVATHTLNSHIDSLASSYQRLLGKWESANPDDRVMIQRDIEYIDSERRRLLSVSTAVGYLSESKSRSNS